MPNELIPESLITELYAVGAAAEQICRSIGSDGLPKPVEVWPGWSPVLAGWTAIEIGSEDDPKDPLQEGITSYLSEAPDWLLPPAGGTVNLKRWFADGSWIEVAAYWLDLDTD